MPARIRENINVLRGFSGSSAIIAAVRASVDTTGAAA
jgi:hypothetical protein